MLEWENVSLKGRSRPRLSELRLKIQPAQLTVILGPNGAGKSSFLNLAAGLSESDSGTITWKGRSLLAWAPRELAAFRAFLSQSISLPFPLKVSELVALGRLPHASRGAREEQAIVTRALELCQAGELRDRLSSELSGGELQRVHTARVIAQAWESQERGEGLLLLDEPTASLDPQHQHATLQLAKALAGRGLSVIAVLHDLNLAARYADRIVYLREGRLLAEGTAREMLSESFMQQVFAVDALAPQDPRLSHPALITLGPSTGSRHFTSLFTLNEREEKDHECTPSQCKNTAV